MRKENIWATRNGSRQASYDLARAAFADPEMRERLEGMVRDTAQRQPVPDDFGWLSLDAKPSESLCFRELSKRLFQVPKEEADEVHRAHEAQNDPQQ